MVCIGSPVVGVFKMVHFKSYKLICIAKLILGNENKQTIELERYTAYNRHIFKTLSSSYCTPDPQEMPPLSRGGLWGPCPCGHN